MRTQQGGSASAGGLAIWQRLSIWAAVCAACGLALSAWIPINKLLWSLSFVLTTSAIGFGLLALLHLIIDDKRLWRGGVLRRVGKNPILLYLGSETLYAALGTFRFGSLHAPNDLLSLALRALGGDSHPDLAHAVFGVAMTLGWVATGVALDVMGIHFAV